MGARPQKVDDWQLRASCRGPDSSFFFPPSSFERKEDKEEREEIAKAICRHLPGASGPAWTTPCASANPTASGAASTRSNGRRCYSVN